MFGSYTVIVVAKIVLEMVTACWFFSQLQCNMISGHFYTECCDKNTLPRIVTNNFYAVIIPLTWKNHSGKCYPRKIQQKSHHMFFVFLFIIKVACRVGQRCFCQQLPQSWTLRIKKAEIYSQELFKVLTDKTDFFRRMVEWQPYQISILSPLETRNWMVSTCPHRWRAVLPW